MKLFLLTSLFFLLTFPAKVQAWGGETHTLMCPQNQPFSCVEADRPEFKTAYPYGNSWHLCLDNRPDCSARLVAKYYLKKYYLEGEKDPKLIGAAAHLFQDASCPDHWYPTRSYFGRIFVPFAPSWVGKMEGLVEDSLRRGQTEGMVFLKYGGKEIEINQAFLASLKTETADFISSEPKESLAELEGKINSRKNWELLRSLKEVLMLLVVILLPLLAFIVWRWQKNKKGLSDVIILASVLGVVLVLLLIIKVFY